MATFVIHPIRDNKLLINNKVYTGLGVAKIATGVENTDKHTLELQEVYNFATQKPTSGFILDLETGSRGWFPGCQIQGFVFKDNVEIKSQESADSETLLTVSKVPVTILNILDITDIPDSGFYKIKYDSLIGYIHRTAINNIRYVSPI